MTITSKDVTVSDDSEVRLTLTVDGAAVQDAYDKLLKDLGKNAQLKGFRRGKVPRDVLIRKFGDSLLGETAQSVIQQGFESALEEVEHKPLQILPPHVDSEAAPEPGKDYTFTVTYDTYPEVELGAHEGLKLEEPQVAVADVDIDRELATLQERNAVVIDKTADQTADEGAEVTVASGDVVTVDYVERGDDDNPVPATERRDFVFEIGTGYNLYQMDDDLVGMTRGQTKTIEKSFADDYQYPDLAGRTVKLDVTVTAVKEKQLPEIDDELAQDINDRFETLDDLKKDIRERLQQNLERVVRQRLISQLLDQIADASTVPLPKSMVRADLEAEWREFVGRVGGNEQAMLAALEQDGQTKDALLEQWRPRVARRGTLMLVVEKLAETLGIEVTDEDVDAALAERAEGGDHTAEEIKQQYEQNNMLGYLRNDLRNEKLYDQLLAGSTVKKGAKVNYLDLVQGSD